MDDPVKLNISGNFYVRELEKVLALNPTWSLRKALMGSVFIERFIILLASKKDENVLIMEEGAYWKSIKIISDDKLLEKKELELVIEHRKKRNWLLHDMVSNTETKREVVETELALMCSFARDIINSLQKHINIQGHQIN